MMAEQPQAASGTAQPARGQQPALSRIKVTMTGDGIHIHVLGERALRYDAELLESEANCLVECAENCMGETDALRVLEMSFYSLAGHVLANDCFARGFGLLPTALGQRREATAAPTTTEPVLKRVTVTRRQDGLEAKVTGPLAQGCDVALCEGVMNAVLSAIETNNCITEQGLLLTKDFFNSLLVHTLQHSCISRGLGLFPAGAMKLRAPTASLQPT